MPFTIPLIKEILNGNIIVALLALPFLFVGWCIVGVVAVFYGEIVWGIKWLLVSDFDIGDGL